jgi:gamma-glutamyltranspeptidase
VIGFELPLNDSIALPRLHHQLFPNYIRAETEFSDKTETTLRSKGHRIIREAPESGAVQCIVTDEQGNIYATSDQRKGGRPAGY